MTINDIDAEGFTVGSFQFAFIPGPGPGARLR
jgi:hypothetical protein